jgi:predicted HTH domain antitoxin
MAIDVTFPEELLVASREDREDFTRHVMIYTLGHLYEQGKISSGIGASVLGCDRWTFYHLLSEHGFAVIDYAEEDMADEAQTSRVLAEQVLTE